MKKIRLISVLIIPFLLTGCKISFWNKDNNNWSDREVDLYRAAGVVDKKISLRYYNDLPNVPYISVEAYFKEFFKRDFTIIKNNNTYTYALASNVYLKFDLSSNTFSALGLQAFNSHPDFKQSNKKLFIKYDGNESSSPQEKIVNMNNYSIRFFVDNDKVYAPFSFLSSISGGLSLYDTSYNGKDVYVLDYGGQLGSATSANSYGASYYSVLKDKTTERKRDLADYNYNELCFVFDNLRGYTDHLVYGDSNLLSLGLNGLLDRFSPKVKEYLLSLDKMKYLEGITALFNGLYDNGHTVMISSFTTMLEAYNRGSESEFITLNNTVLERYNDKNNRKISAKNCRTSSFSVSGEHSYKYNSDSKTAYITFNSFDVDYDGWDNYYNGKGTVPIETDTYAYIRSKLYTAKSDGAKNVVLDLTSNGGGNTYALEGIVGLLHGAKSNFDCNDTFNKYRVTEKHSIDINLDGKFDDLDISEANKFNFNIGILTSQYSFSCGNLLPSVLKSYGYKIIGEKSGGGSCAVALQTTADGLQYAQSSYLCLSDPQGNNIDSGVEVDFPIEAAKLTDSSYDYSNFFNFELVGNYLSSAYL